MKPTTVKSTRMTSMTSIRKHTRVTRFAPVTPAADETPLRRLRRIPAIIVLALARKLGHLLRCLGKELFILGKMVCKDAGKTLGLA
jgi:hypothetical protein